MGKPEMRDMQTSRQSGRMPLGRQNLLARLKSWKGSREEIGKVEERFFWPCSKPSPTLGSTWTWAALRQSPLRAPPPSTLTAQAPGKGRFGRNLRRRPAVAAEGDNPLCLMHLRILQEICKKRQTFVVGVPCLLPCDWCWLFIDQKVPLSF
jgi:hypothetical protein